MRLGICAGHSILSPGAVVEGQTERDWCRRIADCAVELAGRMGWQAYDPRSDCQPLPYPAYLLHRIRAYEAVTLDAAIDVHLNAWRDPAVNYSLTVCASERPEARALAEALAERFTKGLPWPSRGARTDAQLGRRLAFVRRVRHPAVIVEPLFLSNAAARAWLNEPGGVEHIARLIVEGVRNWYERCGEEERAKRASALAAGGAADMADADRRHAHGGARRLSGRDQGD